jgi:hypothetical protein
MLDVCGGGCSKMMAVRARNGGEKVAPHQYTIPPPITHHHPFRQYPPSNANSVVEQFDFIVGKSSHFVRFRWL